MSAPDLDRKILRAIASHIDVLARQDRNFCGSFKQRCREVVPIVEAQQSTVAVDVARWLGHVPAVAERKAVSRSLERLQLAGFVQRISRGDGSRTSAVKLLPAGRKAISGNA